MAKKGVDDSKNINENNADAPSQKAGLGKFVTCANGPIFVIWGPLEETVYETVLDFARKNRAIEKVNLIIESCGGNVDTAFKSGNVLRNCCSRIIAYIPRRAKGAATLMCLAADEIVLGLGAELGPLDAQIVNPKKPTEFISALDSLSALTALMNLLHSEMAVSVAQVSRLLGTKASEALPSAIQFVEVVARPLIEQVNRPDIGTFRNALDIVEKYGGELLMRRGVEEVVARNIVGNLVNLYANHAFVIDVHEACKIGLPVREPNGREDQGLDDLYNYLRARIAEGNQNKYYGLLIEVSN